MVCWQSVARGSRRASLIAFFAMALLTASAIHYLGFLLAFPFAAAEGFRAIQKRRVDWRVAAAIGSPAVVLAAYMPLMRKAVDHVGVHWGKPHLFSAASDVLETFVLPAMPVLAAILIGGFLFTQLIPTPGKPRAVYGLPKDEFVLVMAVLSLPLIALVLGRFATHAFVARYSIEAGSRQCSRPFSCWRRSPWARHATPGRAIPLLTEFLRRHSLPEFLSRYRIHLRLWRCGTTKIPRSGGV
jgi:hypothetical protein